MIRHLVLLADWGLVCFGQEPAPPNVVKGNPFTARFEIESSQTLADGNHIARKSSGLLARDSEGRTRREESIVFIQDPVVGVSYVLEPSTHSAREIGRPAARKAPNASTSKATRTDLKSESLGVLVIDGISVEGTRLTRMLAPSQVGNERPIEIVLESWYSPDLQVVIAKKTIDPRFGEVNYRLREIQRGEPPASLFNIPAEYTLREKLVERRP